MIKVELLDKVHLVECCYTEGLTGKLINTISLRCDITAHNDPIIKP